MKMKRNIVAAAMALSLVAGVALATTTATPDPQIPAAGPGYGRMNGQGMMNGQGPGSMRGQGMMGNNGQDCFRDNAGPCMGMGHKGMKQGRCYKNRGGAMMNPEMVEKRNAFLDATVELRKQIHDKQFAYREATRNPAMTQGELQAQEKEIFTMRQELQAKRQAAFAAE
ncbi:hypothetical protein UWK_01278 [Desulfocapsa sulfexigens DSM 10523]|uniref:Uncharacterized protein n=1 Tax=Desulfocapsa sulfexigens (strain DSM 10523 / SB164P1) TaxID=1167006 RepID=M1PN20_DESSD|nr:hypothetical protein [Desulfocapsa sulfexigens]AGF77841.1 hypothetical protein UWK_01278 [Desulfocapsa sulfexigens DSM 10523]